MIVLSHSQKEGYEFIFKIGESTWSKVNSTRSLLREPPGWLFHLFEDDILRSSRCWDRTGGYFTTTKGGSYLYGIVMEWRTREIQALESDNSCAPFFDKESTARNYRFPRARCCTKRSMSGRVRKSMYLPNSAFRRREAPYSSLSWFEHTVVSIRLSLSRRLLMFFLNIGHLPSTSKILDLYISVCVGSEKPMNKLIWSERTSVSKDPLFSYIWALPLKVGPSSSRMTVITL